MKLNRLKLLYIKHRIIYAIMFSRFMPEYIQDAWLKTKYEELSKD